MGEQNDPISVRGMLFENEKKYSKQSKQTNDAKARETLDVLPKRKVPG